MNESIAAQLNNWNYPTRVRVGAGSVRTLARCCAAQGMSAPMLVTDPGLYALPRTREVIDELGAANLQVGVFSEIKSNPTIENVEAGARRFREGGHDGVIAYGGGSALDTGKTIAMYAGQTGDLNDYVDEGDNWTRINADVIAPIIAVATTAGTGSEVGRASVITDNSAKVKRIIFHPHMLPGQVILDPELTVGLPAHITAATGMDALSHNLEALCSPVYHPMAAGIAVEGIRLVNEFLLAATRDGSDLEARMQMLVASTMGATAFQRGLGAMHALSHPLGALYDAHHGLLNAIVMPYVLIANEHVITDVLARLGSYLGLANASFSGVVDHILGLRESLDIPHRLADIGIDDADAELVGQMAVVDPTAATNPISFSPQQYSELFARAVDGKI